MSPPRSSSEPKGSCNSTFSAFGRFGIRTVQNLFGSFVFAREDIYFAPRCFTEIKVLPRGENSR